MKRGRPSARGEMGPLILDILSDNTARSINSLVKEISKRKNKEVSWNTVQKYMQELVESGRIMGIATQHSKKEGEQGITVYRLKR